jgi:hypothetical protein
MTLSPVEIGIFALIALGLVVPFAFIVVIARSGDAPG